jgi:protein involved in polysaccharide export with SLBB domain
MSRTKLLIALVLVVSGSVVFYPPADALATALQETRAGLIAEANEAEQQANKESNAARRSELQQKAQRIRARLDSGDIRNGDRIVIEVIRPLPELAFVADTYEVRVNQTLQLKDLKGDISLRGILRSELNDHITTFLKRDYTNPQIRTRTMIPIVVTGEVTEAGARPVEHDALLRDVVIAKGSILSTADYNKISIIRDNKVIFPPDSVREAIAQGRTVNDLQLIAGDEIDVGVKRRLNWLNIAQISTAVVGLFIAVYSLSR